MAHDKEPNLTSAGRPCQMTTLALALLLFAIGAPPTSSAEPDFDQALLEAEASLRSVEGQEYDKEFGKKSAKHVAAALNACLPGSGATPASFDVLLRVAADGAIGAALVRPKGRGPDCVASQLKRRTFPKPPVDGTWKAVRVRLNP